MTHPCAFITTDNSGGPSIYDDIMYMNDSGYFPSSKNHNHLRPKRRFNVINNLYKSNNNKLSSKEVMIAPFSLMAAATATARSMMALDNHYDDTNGDNTTVTTASESSASSTSLPSLCLERDLSLSNKEAENHPTIFDSLVDVERPPSMDDDDDGDDDDDDDEADLMGFCDSFFSEKQQQNNTAAVPSKVTSSSSIPTSSSSAVADRVLKCKNNNNNNIVVAVSTKATKKQNNSSSKTKTKKVGPVKKKEQPVKNKKPSKKSSSSSSTKKKSSMNTTHNTNTNGATKFRPYQAEKWKERYEDLLQFRRVHGHCLVPHTYPQNPILARWVKRQRYQYKLFQMKEQSSMTIERISLLNTVGFVWHSHEVVWQERLNELLHFKEQHGHCLVPSNYPPNPKLATWVKCQRRQYKLHLRGSPATNITDARIQTLEKYGFEWQLRSSSHSIEKEIAAHQKNLRLLKMKEVEEALKLSGEEVLVINQLEQEQQEEDNTDDPSSSTVSKTITTTTTTAAAAAVVVPVAEVTTSSSSLMTTQTTKNESSNFVVVANNNDDDDDDTTCSSISVDEYNNNIMDFDYFTNFMEEDDVDVTTTHAANDDFSYTNFF